MSSLPGYSELSRANAWDVLDDASAIMADNHTCWNDGHLPTLTACPFTASSETINRSQRSSRQFMFRIAAFVLIQNAQTVLILVSDPPLRKLLAGVVFDAQCVFVQAISSLSTARESATVANWKRERLAQHQLVAEELFPTSTKELVGSVVEAYKKAARLHHTHSANHSSDPDLPGRIHPRHA
jgi:hypothetical protein